MDPEVLEFDIGLGGGGSSGRDGDDDANIGLDVDEGVAHSPVPSQFLLMITMAGALVVKFIFQKGT